ncbi:MAG: hypothetical protein HRT61_00695 [Ekhidna sp.]|nr:hypothetical protein [Ekhidna sp.]
MKTIKQGKVRPLKEKDILAFYAKKRGQGTIFRVVSKRDKLFLGWELIGTERKKVHEALTICKRGILSDDGVVGTTAISINPKYWSDQGYKITYVL